MSVSSIEGVTPDRHTRSVRVASAVFAVVCVIVSAVGLKLTDDPIPFHKVTATVGQMVVIEGVQLTVVDVTVGQTLANNKGVPLVRSAGVFVAVDVLLACPGPSGNPASSTKLVAGRRSYREWKSSGALAPDAGYRTTSRLVFEVDPADLGELVLDAQRLEIIGGYQAHAWVDLGLAARADQLRAEAPSRAVNEAYADQEPIS